MGMFSQALIGVTLFAGCYPVLFLVIDSITLYIFKSFAAKDSLTGAMSAMAASSTAYIALPILSFKLFFKKGHGAFLRTRDSFSQSFGIRKLSKGIAYKGAAAGFNVGYNHLSSRHNISNDRVDKFQDYLKAR